MWRNGMRWWARERPRYQGTHERKRWRMEAWRQVGTTVAEVHWRLLQVEVVCVCLCVWAQSYPTLCNPWTVGHQAPLSMGFSRQEYWTGLPFPPPGDLPDPGIEPASPALAGRFSITALLGKPVSFLYILNYFKFSIKYHFNLFWHICIRYFFFLFGALVFFDLQ